MKGATDASTYHGSVELHVCRHTIQRACVVICCVALVMQRKGVVSFEFRAGLRFGDPMKFGGKEQ